MNAATLPADVAQALEQLDEAFAGRVSTQAGPDGGVVVCVRGVELSARWTPQTGDLWFAIPYHYPDAAIYPYYLTGATVTGGLVGGLQPIEWQGTPAIQISLRHSAWDPARDNAVGSVLQTQAWLRSQ